MYIVPIAQIKDTDIREVGAKAVSLARLYASRVRVPEGFALTEEARRSFLAHNQLGPVIETELARLQVEELHSIDYASRVLQEAIMSATFPPEIESAMLQQFAQSNTQDMPRVSVRSSAFAPDQLPDAWSAQLRTDLNVSAFAMPEAVKRCWASLYSAKSLYLAASHHVRLDAVGHAVVIQRFIPAQAAGLVYTVHPVHRDPNLMVIEAGRGLGDGIERGTIVPDTYTLTKKPLKLIEKHVVEQTARLAADENEGTTVLPIEGQDGSTLSDKQILELAKIAQRLEKTWEQPLCLEWCRDDDWFFLQARIMKLD